MIKYHAQFLLDKEKDNPTAKLRYRIKWDKNIVAFNVGYRIEIDKWSKDTQRCKINTSHGSKKIPASIINRKIQDYEQACEKVFSIFYLEGKVPSADEFRRVFNTEIGREVKEKRGETFFEIYDLFMEEEGKKNQWSKTTIRKMTTQKNNLLLFNPALSFSAITEKTLIEYQYFLQYSLELRSSTILKKFSYLKRFLKWSKKNNYLTLNEFEEFSPKLKTIQKKIIFLTQKELQQVREYEIPSTKKHLEKIRDVFLFLCFTGLRYSDVANLKKADVKDNSIEVTTLKTTDSLIIELNKHSKSILDKYKEDIFLKDTKMALPVISNQKMNHNLKELMKLAGIDEQIRVTYYKGNKRIDKIVPKYELIGTHAGRRTFICNALSLGIPPQIIMKWTGHSDYDEMKPYIDIADETKANAMDRFNLL